MTAGARRVRCVGAIIVDGDGRLLLVQRGHEPDTGRWSIPGGRVEPAETDRQAVTREVAEETGLAVEPGDLAGMVERAGPGGAVYEIYDYDCSLRSGAAVAASDAAALCWAGPAELATLPLTSGLLATLRQWGRLP